MQEIQRILGSPRLTGLSRISTQLSRIYLSIYLIIKIELLSTRVRVEVDPGGIRDPIVVLLTACITPCGAEMSFEQAMRIYIAGSSHFNLYLSPHPRLHVLSTLY